MAEHRTPLRRIRGLGSAKHGVGAFIGQRVSAAALVVLVLWGVFSALGLARADFGAATYWLRSPWHAVPTALLLAISCYHMRIGMADIVHDYIHKASTKTVLMLLNTFVCWAAGAVGVFSILKVAFSGGAY